MKGQKNLAYGVYRITKDPAVLVAAFDRFDRAWGWRERLSGPEDYEVRNRAGERVVNRPKYGHATAVLEALNA